MGMKKYVFLGGVLGAAFALLFFVILTLKTFYLNYNLKNLGGDVNPFLLFSYPLFNDIVVYTLLCVTIGLTIGALFWRFKK